jgi:SAM-dependent methyltransferase
MTRNLRLGEMRLAVEGLGLIRSIFSGRDQQVTQRLDGMRHALGELDSDDPNAMAKISVNVSELDPAPGYALWSEVYDTMSNALLDVDEPLVRELVGPGPLGDVLDACTGTGRHLNWLATMAASVTGLDLSPEMLAVAKAKVPSASFLVGDLLGDHQGDLPDASFDLVVCSLALTHFASLHEPIATLARLVRPGGRIVLSDTHPVMNLLDGQAFFPHDEGSTPFVRNHPHLISDYLIAFERFGLVVEACREPTVVDGAGPLADGVMMSVAPQSMRAAYLGLPLVLGWSLRRMR